MNKKLLNYSDYLKLEEISGDVDNFARCSVVKFREVVDDLENTRDSSSRNPNWWTEASLWADKKL